LRGPGKQAAYDFKFCRPIFYTQTLGRGERLLDGVLFGGGRGAQLDVDDKWTETTNADARTGIAYLVRGIPRIPNRFLTFFYPMQA